MFSHAGSALLGSFLLAQMCINQFQQFVVHCRRFLGLPAFQGLRRAMVQMVFHQVSRHSAQCFLYRSNLHDDVGAIAIVRDHTLQSPDLPFNPPQPLHICRPQFRINSQRFAPFPGAIQRRAVCCFRRSHRYTPYPYIYSSMPRSVKPLPGGAAIIPSMTLLEITYELQSPLSLEQLNRLGEFANTYGLRKFRVDEQKNQVTFEYDASRLRDTQIAHVLGQAGIAVTRRVN